MARMVRGMLALALAALALPAGAVELVSKNYLFKRGIKLEMGVDLVEGLRLESVQFSTPQGLGSRILRPSGTVKAEVTVANLGVEAKRFGIAIALYDDRERLVGVASGGASFALKPERKSTYTLIFEDVKLHATDAQSFTIAIETKL